MRFSLIPGNLVAFLLGLWRLRHLLLLTVVLLLLMVLLMLLLVTGMIAIHSRGLAVFTATAVAAVTIGSILYSVIVLVPAPAILAMALVMPPAMTLTSHKEAQAARILSRDLLDEGKLSRARVAGARAVSHVQIILGSGGQRLGQAQSEVWVLDMEDLLGLLSDPGVKQNIGPGAGAGGRKRSGKRKLRQKLC